MIFIDINDSARVYKDELKKKGLLFVAVDYKPGFYEGEGNALCCFGKDDWFHNNCCHCSCNDAFDSFDPEIGTGEPLEKLIASFSDDLKKECNDIIKVARKFEGGNNE